jgi:hypothetical protein
VFEKRGQPGRIGGWTYNDGYQLDGVVVHFFVWNRLLTDAEVQQLYNCGWRDPCPPLDGLAGVDRSRWQG